MNECVSVSYNYLWAGYLSHMYVVHLYGNTFTGGTKQQLVIPITLTALSIECTLKTRCYIEGS